MPMVSEEYAVIYQVHSNSRAVFGQSVPVFHACSASIVCCFLVARRVRQIQLIHLSEFCGYPTAFFSILRFWLIEM